MFWSVSLAWTIEFSATSEKQLRKLDKAVAKQILGAVKKAVRTPGGPRATGKALKGSLGGYWRYRSGNYRIICTIEDAKLQVLVIRLGDRRDVYEEMGRG